MENCLQRNGQIGWVLGALLVMGAGWSKPVRAESVLVPDTTLDAESSVVNNLDDLNQVIEGGAVRESNLFHSFLEFNVAEDYGVYFANPADIESILTRVTGDNSSNIFGRLGVLGGANLFLLNPNGIVFGENASLDVNGSFYASTAEAISLGEGVFSATEPESSQLLTVNPKVTFFSYLMPGLGEINNSGDLSVGSGKTLTLLGGTVLSSGALTAPGGAIQVLGNLVGLVDQATVDVSGATGGGTVLVGGDYQGQETVPVAERTFVGSEVVIGADALETGDGGRVIVWADDATQFLGRISAQGGPQGGDGGFVEVSGLEVLDFAGEVNTQAVQGEAGQLLLDPANIVIAEVAPVGFVTVGQGNGIFTDFLYGEAEDAEQDSHLTPDTVEALLDLNDLTLEATDIIIVVDDVDAFSSNNLVLQASNIEVIDVRLGQSGGGDIVLETPQLPGSSVSVDSGRIDTNVLSGTNLTGGNVRITTHDLVVENDGLIGASTRGEGNSGLVQIMATGNTVVDGTSSFIASQVSSNAIGNSGGISITTDNLSILNDASVSSGIFGQGNSGPVEIVATGDVVVDGTSSFIASQVSSTAVGSSGGISITTNNLFVVNDASVSSSTFGQGNGGPVEIVATGDVIVDGTDSLIASQVIQGAVGNSGGISITTDNLSVLNDASVSSGTFGQGSAGAVEIAVINNVDIGDYRGASLQVSAGNDITYGTVVIDAIDPALNPNNRTFLLEAGGSITGTGEVSTTIATSPLEVVFQSQGDIDVQSFSTAGGDITFISNNGKITTGERISTNFVNDNSVITLIPGGNVTLDSQGDIEIKNVIGTAGGDIILTSRDGAITAKTDIFPALSTNFQIGGGDIILDAEGDILIDGALNSTALSFANPGNGGNIEVSSQSGNITINRDVLSWARSLDATGSGGGIKISAQSGDITIGGEVASDAFSADGGESGVGGTILIFSQLGDINLLDRVYSSSTLNSGNAGSGGAIAVSSQFGDIILSGDLFSSSFSPDGNVGDGGRISLSAPVGSIRGNDIQVSTFSVPGEDGIAGRGGDVRLEVEETIFGLEVLTLSAAGESGSVQIQGLGDVILRDTRFVTSAQVTIPNPPSIVGPRSVFISDIGQSGNVFITSTGNLILDNVEILSDANSAINAGNIFLSSPGIIQFTNSQINTNTNSEGNAGLITINAERLSLGEGDQILAATLGTGNGGSIIINATEAVLLGEGVQDFAPIISVEASGAGRPGNITISTPNFVLSETAQITATATTTATNTEEGGSITLSADQMDLAGTVGIFAETQGQAPGGILTLQPYQTNPDLSLTLAEGAVVSASTTGSGDGGSLTISAPTTITISGPGSLEVETLGTGRAGDITLTTQSLVLSDDVILSASTTGSGAAGDITFNVSESLTIDGSTVESITESESTGLGGNINFNLDTTDIILRNGGQIVVNSDGQGQGGNVELIANELNIDNSLISAATASTEGGGNLNFSVDEGIVLRQGSFINAESTNTSGGDGGNITLDADFVLAIPSENSDIIANAVGGDGGNILINAAGIFGLTEQSDFRTTEELRANDSSDISASSQSGQQGTINLNADFEQTQALDELPDNFINADQLVASSCIARSGDVDSAFAIAGNGGLPQQPDSATGGYSTGTIQTVPEATGSQSFQEPTGVYQLADGRLVMSQECQE